MGHQKKMLGGEIWAAPNWMKSFWMKFLDELQTPPIHLVDIGTRIRYFFCFARKIADEKI